MRRALVEADVRGDVVGGAGLGEEAQFRAVREEGFARQAGEEGVVVDGGGEGGLVGCVSVELRGIRGGTG